MVLPFAAEMLKRSAEKGQPVEKCLSEFLQRRFIEYSSRRKAGRQMTLLGGGVLFHTRGSPRFSYDLDYRCQRLNAQGLYSLVKGFADWLQQTHNLPCELRDTFHDRDDFHRDSATIFLETSPRIEGRLTQGVLRVECRFTEKSLLPETEGLFGMAVLRTEALDELYTEKLLCLGLRQEPRDFFDVLFLHETARFNPEVARARLREWQGEQGTGEWAAGVDRLLNETGLLATKLKQCAADIFGADERDSFVGAIELYGERLRKLLPEVRSRLRQGSEPPR